jgi:hypothetical protein
MRKEYLKFTPEEKEELKGELKNPIALLSSILMPAGSMLIFITLAFPSVILRCVAFGLIGIGMIIEGAELSTQTQTSRGMLLVVLGASTVLITGFLATKSFW